MMLSIYFNRRRVGGGRQGRWAEGKWSLSFSPRSRCSTSATATLYKGRVKDAIVRPRLAKVFEHFFRPILEEVSMTSVLSLCYLKLNWCFAAMMTMIRRNLQVSELESCRGLGNYLRRLPIFAFYSFFTSLYLPFIQPFLFLYLAFIHFFASFHLGFIHSYSFL